MVNWKIVTLLIGTLLAISCRKDIDRTTNDTREEEPQVYINCSVAGVVQDETGQPLQGVQLQLDGYTQTTDDNGVFYFKDILANQRAALVRASLQGYADALKSFIPLVNNVHFLTIIMTKAKFDGDINGLTGGEFSFGQGGQGTLKVPAKAWIDSNGKAYEGKVALEVNPLESLHPYDLSLLPSPLYGHDQKEEMASIHAVGGCRLRAMTANGAPLFLDQGISLTLELPIASGSDYASSSESELPVWHFDETTGLWKEQSTADLTNGRLALSLKALGWHLTGPALPAGRVEVQVKTAGQQTLPYVNIDYKGKDLPISYFSAYCTDEGRMIAWLPTGGQLDVEVEEGKVQLTDDQITPKDNTENIALTAVHSAPLSYIDARLLDCEGAEVQWGYFKVNGERVYPFRLGAHHVVQWLTTLPKDSVHLIQGVDLRRGVKALADDLIYDTDGVHGGDLLACTPSESIFFQVFIEGEVQRIAIPAYAVLATDTTVEIKCTFFNDRKMELILPADLNMNTEKAITFSLFGDGIEVETGINVIGDVQLVIEEVAKKKGDTIRGSLSCKFELDNKQRALEGAFKVLRKY